MIELKGRRTLNSKTFDLGGGKHRLVVQPSALHYSDDSGRWREIDTAIQPDLTVSKSIFRFSIPDGEVGFDYESKRGGSASVRLEGLTGSIPAPVVDGNTAVWEEVGPGVDVKIEIRPRGVFVWKTIKNRQASHEFVWGIEEDENQRSFEVQTKTKGTDKDKKQLEIRPEIQDLGTRRGKKRHRIKEQVTGRFAKIDPVTRVKKWEDGAQYPLLIDQDITETIITNNDDGHEFEASGFWYYTGPYNYFGYSTPICGALTNSQFVHMGFRFQSINVLQGATISLATLKLEVKNSSVAAAGFVYGDDVDTAPGWGPSDRPAGITKTTAKTAVTFASSGTKDIDVTAIVQEIVDRPLWPFGGDMRFAALATSPVGSCAYADIYDYGYGSNFPILEIDFDSAEVTLDKGLGISQSASVVASASLTLARSSGLATTNTISVNADVSLSRQLGIASSAMANAEASLALGRSLVFEAEPLSLRAPVAIALPPEPPIVAETYDSDDRQYRLDNISNARYSNHYGEEGSGYGYFSFTIWRKLGIDYIDIGLGYRIILRKGLRTILFAGIITKIDESSTESEVFIAISCVGDITLLSFYKKNFILSDIRLDMWLTPEVDFGSSVPSKFEASTTWDDAGDSISGLQLKPRRGAGYLVNEYTRFRYTFQFGETAARITFDWETEFLLWAGKLEVRDQGGNVLFSQIVTSSGSEDLAVVDTTSTYVEIRLYATVRAENDEENEIYARLTNVKIYSTTDLIDVSRVAQEVVAAMVDNYGFSADLVKLAAIGNEIVAAYDEDQTLSDIMATAAAPGDGNLRPVAWGIEFNTKRRLFVEVQDLVAVSYVIPRATALNANIAGDIGASYQAVYGVYEDEVGNTMRTAVYSDQTTIDALAGIFKLEAIELGQMTEAQAITAVQMALSENKKPGTTSSFTVSSPVERPGGERVSIEEIVAGGLVVVNDFKAREATLTPNDQRSGFTTFMLVGVEVDLESKATTLIPAGDYSTFEKYMASLARML